MCFETFRAENFLSRVSYLLYVILFSNKRISHLIKKRLKEEISAIANEFGRSRIPNNSIIPKGSVGPHRIEFVRFIFGGSCRIMQTSVAMTAFTSLNKFMRREVWHLADRLATELNNVQQTSRASTLILITEQTTWLQSDALMKTFTSSPGSAGIEWLAWIECLHCLRRGKHEGFADSINVPRIRRR